jgi:hypothetical protein
MAERGTHIIPPDMASTLEYRTNQSRFFIKLDPTGIVVGGDLDDGNCLLITGIQMNEPDRLLT